MTETDDVTAPVLVALSALPGGVFWRQNAGTFRTMDGNRVVKVTVPGIADIMGCYRGRAMAVETKSRRGIQRITQLRFQDAWQRAGGVYVIVRSVEQAIAAVLTAA